MPIKTKLFSKTFYIKKGDTSPSLAIQVIREDNSNSLDLTGATAAFSMEDRTGTTKVDSQACQVVDASDGKVQYNWVIANTDTPGTYKGEFVITLESGGITTVPSNGYIKVEILDSI